MNDIKDLANLSFSGPNRIWAMFDPLHKVSLAKCAPVLGVSYSRLFRREKEGTLGLRVQKDELGRMFVAVQDLVEYLYPSNTSDPISDTPSQRPAKTRKRQQTKSRGV